MVKVEILGCVMTAQYGTLSAGTILATDEAFAKHLVDDCGAAKYVDAQPVGAVEVVDPKPAKPAKPAK